MFDKITNYLDAASNNIKVASAKMERHSQEMLEKAEDSFFDEFGVSIEEHKAAQLQPKHFLNLKLKLRKRLIKWTFSCTKRLLKLVSKQNQSGLHSTERTIRITLTIMN